jgi:hypothetical protein
MTQDEMLDHMNTTRGECLFDMAHREHTLKLDCPQCSASYWCHGSWVPVFTTAIEEDDL